MPLHRGREEHDGAGRLLRSNIPKLHELAASKNPVVRTLHDFHDQAESRAAPPRTFLKPFMREQTAEFCSVAATKCISTFRSISYRWIRGFNEYDNWQASGVSGQGARSFYYPPKPQQCADCHMPLRALEGCRATSTASCTRIASRAPTPPFRRPTNDPEQLEADGELPAERAADAWIFSRCRRQSRAKPRARRRPHTELSTTFAVGEEADSNALPKDPAAKRAPVTAPLERVNAAVRRGDTYRVDVVVRTEKVGHFFPGGTVDAYRHVAGTEGHGRQRPDVFWSGKVEDDGKGPVEKGAHFYRSLQIDAHGNPINKRNAWATRAVVYVRLIPPGAADTVHYRMHIPENAGEQDQSACPPATTASSRGGTRSLPTAARKIPDQPSRNHHARL